MLTSPLSAPLNLKASNWNRSTFSAVRAMNLESEPVSLASTKHLRAKKNIQHDIRDGQQWTTMFRVCDCHENRATSAHSPMVIDEGVVGVGGPVRGKSSYTAVQVNTEGHVIELLDGSLNVNDVSQEVLVDWPLILPVICDEIITLIIKIYKGSVTSLMPVTLLTRSRVKGPITQ